MAVRYRSTACDDNARALFATEEDLPSQRSVLQHKPLGSQRSAASDPEVNIRDLSQI